MQSEKDTMMKEEIFSTVRSCVAESLAIREEQIHLDSRLIDDLGADSLDFLDMIFSLEKRFSTRLRDPNLDLLIRADFSQTRTTQEGYLSPESVEKLGDWLPAIMEAPDPQKISLRNVYSFITVDTLVRLIERKLAEPAE